MRVAVVALAVWLGLCAAIGAAGPASAAPGRGDEPGGPPAIVDVASAASAIGAIGAAGTVGASGEPGAVAATDAIDEPAAQSSNPLLTGVDAADGQGIPIVNYQTLPLDRGDALDSHATMTAWLTDAAWTAHVGVIALSLQLLDWVLSFSWLDWILGPVDAARGALAGVVGGVAWAPFALLVAALVGGIVAFRGRLGAGITQLGVSAICFALATTVMLAPLSAITGSDDPVGDARDAGQAVADAVVADVLAQHALGGGGLDGAAPGDADEVSAMDGTGVAGVGPTGAGSTGAGRASAGSADAGGGPVASVAVPRDAGDSAVAMLRTRLVTLFVRGAAQEVAFGARLDGTPCGEVFTQAMRDEPPSPGSAGVRDAVGACSEEAGAYASEPSLWQPFSVVVTMLGSVALLGFVAILSLALLGAVLTCVVAALRAMLWVNVAILPGVGRQRFTRAIADAAASLVAVAVLIVAVAGASALIVVVAGNAADAGTPLATQMAWVAGVTIACGIGIASVGQRLRSTSRSAVAAIASFVRGDGAGPPRPAPQAARLAGGRGG